MTEEADDVAYPNWCCTVCAARFNWGSIILSTDGMHCPECRGVTGLQPVDDEPRYLRVYHGETGTLN